VRVAELESRGSVDIRAREDAMSTFSNKISVAEDDFKSWVRGQLPRLVSGLPVSEDCIADYYDADVYGPAAGAGLTTAGGAISAQLQQSLGLDRTYALTQAVCSIKAQQSAQDLKITSLRDKISILKERNQTLETVLLQWKREIESPVPHLITSEDKQSHIALYSMKAEADIGLQTQNALLSQRLQEMEEANIECNARLSHARDRSAEIQNLFDAISGDEHKLKQKTSQQITKIRLELENEHAAELRRLRESYENEKSALIRELSEVNHAVVEAEEMARADGGSAIPMKFFPGPIVSGSQMSRSPSGTSSSTTSSSDTSSPGSTSSSSSSSSSSPSSSSRTGSKSDNGTRENRGRRRSPSVSTSPSSRSSTSSSRSTSPSRSHSSSQSLSASTSTPVKKTSKLRKTPLRSRWDGQSSEAMIKQPSTAEVLISKSQQGMRVSGAQGSEAADQRGREAARSLRPSRHTIDVAKINEKASKYEAKGTLRDQYRRVASKYQLGRQKLLMASKELDELNQLLHAQRNELNKLLNSGVRRTSVDSADDVGQGSLYLSPTTPEVRSGPTDVDASTPFAAASRQGLDSTVRLPFIALIDIMGELAEILKSLNNPHHPPQLSVRLLHTGLGMIDRMRAILTEAAKGGQLRPGDRQASHEDPWSVRDETEHVGTNDVETSFKFLVNRMSMLESDFADENIPERHLFLLRDLRQRVIELEKNLVEEFDTQRAAWEREREQLLRASQHRSDETEQLRSGHGKVIDNIRRRYEDALNQSQDAVEMQTATAKEQINRLEELLRRTHDGDSHHAGNSTDSRDIYKTLHQAQTELEYNRQKISCMDAVHAAELRDLRSHFYRYKLAQEGKLYFKMKSTYRDFVGSQLSLKAWRCKSASYAVLRVWR
jgi:hypothetical protein